ncbi:ABC transporter ATP-binding protein [Roseovarius arcticus]|uniref:ABC transporter ATP-binding protein n=1 Tax=Roseovarius arcticus TaxID=2547404 RepID=UPI0011102248|nr:ABC transporter ATP-binding protein [Roseovarius arcticus]
MSDPLLAIKDLVVEGYQDEQWNRIVRGVSLTLKKGEVLGLIGESGAGKSTLGIAAMGHVRPGCRIASGSIMFDGIDMTTAPEEKLRKMRGVRIAYVAQSAAAAFNPAHTLMQQFTETPVFHGVMDYKRAKKSAQDLFKVLDLPDPEKIGNRYPHQVSGGQLQRAMVAMAMACNPDLIIFDEPTTALDVTTQIEVLAAIKDAIRNYDTAALYISHDLAVVSQIADRIMVLRNGGEVETGKTRQIIENPREEYTRALVSVNHIHKDKLQPKDRNREVLVLRNISASYGRGVKILDDVSITLTQGKTVALVGESGSGKSTAARVITGLLPPDEGEISFQGEPLAPSFRDRPKDVLRRIQMIYQMPDVALNPRMKVKDVIGRPLAFYFGLTEDTKDQRVAELLEKIELGDTYLDRYPSELSGGEKQRVCIARALAAEPELIVCDEITSALDPLVAEGILKLLQDLQNDLAVSYLFITHDLATVKAISDEIVVMHQGRVVEQGTRDEILTPPHHEYTELLLSSVPEMDPHWLTNVLQHRKELQANLLNQKNQ